MRCCAECFGDIGLRAIIPSLSSGAGQCDYCRSKSGSLVDPSRLFDLFSSVKNVYEENKDGHELAYWFRKDWSLFGHPKMNDSRVKHLLKAILGDEEGVDKKYIVSKRFKSNRLERWEQLTTELRRRNRFFPEVEMDLPRLEELLKFLRAQDLESKWFRARINADDRILSTEKMGAPPVGIASHGRANPPGIPYLYVGSTPETSVSEIRPHAGESATVAEFEIDAASISIVDLRSPKELISPFSLGDEDKIGALRSDIDFLQRLGSELTRPVRPQTAPVEYVPSQYLCEFIKKSGWDGVLYSSSVSEGMNLALFDPNKAECSGVSLWRVTKVRAELEEVE